MKHSTQSLLIADAHTMMAKRLKIYYSECHCIVSFPTFESRLFNPPLAQPGAPCPSQQGAPAHHPLWLLSSCLRPTGLLLLFMTISVLGHRLYLP